MAKFAGLLENTGGARLRVFVVSLKGRKTAS